MGWYRTGTVNVAANSATITGVGTAFLDNAKIGDEFAGPDGRSYEITNIATNTSLTVMPAYKGATATGQAYHIKPTQSWAREAALQLAGYTGRVGGAIQKAEGAVQVSQLLVGEDGAIAGQTGVPTQGWRGLGTLARVWRVCETTQDAMWVKLGTFNGAQNRRATVYLTGGATGYGAGSNSSAGFGVLSLTMGNSGSEDNLNVQYLHTGNHMGTGSGGSRSVQSIMTERHSNLSFTVWLRVTPFASLVAEFVGDLSVTPFTGQMSAVAPVGFDKSTQIFPFITGINYVGEMAAGGVVQSGSNANGSWVRFADGTQEARHLVTLATPTNPDEPIRGTHVPPVSFVGIPAKSVVASVGDENAHKNYQFREIRGQAHADIRYVLGCVGPQVERATTINFIWRGRWKQ